MRCPQCHKPLEYAAEGLYICCAAASRRWRCLDCEAEARGFCVRLRCLSVLRRPFEWPLTLPQRRTAALWPACEWPSRSSSGGRAFYQRAAADSSDPQMRELFSRFAVMEGEHMETLARRYHVPEVPSPPALRLDVAALFGGVDHRPRDPDNLFRIAIAMEQRAARFFTDTCRTVGQRLGRTRELFRELAAEERGTRDVPGHRVRAVARRPARAGGAGRAVAGGRRGDGGADQRRRVAARWPRPAARRAGLRRPAADLRRVARTGCALRRGCGPRVACGPVTAWRDQVARRARLGGRLPRQRCGPAWSRWPSTRASRRPSGTTSSTRLASA